MFIEWKVSAQGYSDPDYIPERIQINGQQVFQYCIKPCVLIENTKPENL